VADHPGETKGKKRTLFKKVRSFFKNFPGADGPFNLY